MSVCCAVFLVCCPAASWSGDFDNVDPSPGLAAAMANLYPSSVLQKVVLTTLSGGVEVGTRHAQLLRGDESKYLRLLVRFTYPQSLRGTGLLVSADGDDFHLFLPALRMVRRVAGGQLKDGFFGTAFAYEDLLSKRPADFAISQLDAAGGCGESYLLVPRPGSRFSYREVEACVSGRNFAWLRISGDRPVEEKVLKIHAGQTEVVESVTVVVTGSGLVTRLAIEEQVPLSGPADRLFELGNLERGDADRDSRRAQIEGLDD